MPSSDYSSATGGALKLKGSSGVDKKKKKKKVAKAAADSTGDSAGAATSSSAAAKADKKDERDAEDDERISKALADEDGAELSDDAKKELAGVRGKTDAEKRYEEMRRKRLNERLKREGIKTHKERVEELNRYLSNLSEHHDMPRIGPG